MTWSVTVSTVLGGGHHCAACDYRL